MTELVKDYGLREVAEAIGRSDRWIRQRIKDGEKGEGPAIEHIRYGGARNATIRFTAEQVEKFRAQFTKSAPTTESVTTGRKRRAS